MVEDYWVIVIHLSDAMGFKMKIVWNNAKIASLAIIAIIRQFHTDVYLSGPKGY